MFRITKNLLIGLTALQLSVCGGAAALASSGNTSNNSNSNNSNAALVYNEAQQAKYQGFNGDIISVHHANIGDRNKEGLLVINQIK